MNIQKLKIHIIILILVTISLTSCKTKYVNTIVGCDYNKENDRTDYFVLPYGSVSIPGKWDKAHYRSSSKQQFFKNSDSVTIAVAFTVCNKFEFNTDNSKHGHEFVTEHYEWDSEYFVKNYGMTREVLERDSIENYIIWRFFGMLNEKAVDTYLLFGEKNCYVTIFTIFEINKWSQKQKIDFLKSLYIQEKE